VTINGYLYDGSKPVLLTNVTSITLQLSAADTATLTSVTISYYGAPTRSFFGYTNYDPTPPTYSTNLPSELQVNIRIDGNTIQTTPDVPITTGGPIVPPPVVPPAPIPQPNPTPVYGRDNPQELL
jgi:hypothetical protein